MLGTLHAFVVMNWKNDEMNGVEKTASSPDFVIALICQRRPQSAHCPSQMPKFVKCLYAIYFLYQSS